LLVLRENTERPECVESGNARLIGLDGEIIVAAVTELMDDPMALAAMSRRAMPFGDGAAGGRIAAVISDWLGEKMGSHLRTA
jgi:UDP-N-acetylglucosamine 2-epimerase (non-hydrolysing)